MRSGRVMPIIQLKNVNLDFEGSNVLHSVNLSVQRGEVLVVVGPSGHGKTSLLKLMTGLLSPTNGEVFVEGANSASLGVKQREDLVKKMGMLFQKNALFDSFTCGENIAFPLRELTDLSEAEIQKKVEYFLEAVGIAHSINLYPDEISGGMQKRLGIARALALDPEIIFYDDPTAGLDPITSKKIVELIINLQKSRGSTVIAVTNDMNRAFQMATRMVVVVDGEVILTGTPEQTRESKEARVYQFVRGLLDGPLSVVE